MIIADQILDGRSAVLAATGDHPYARHSLGRDGEPRGWRRDGAVVWLLPAGQRPTVAALGAAGPVLDVCADLVAEGVLGAGRWLNLPRLDPADLTGRLPVAQHDEWYFLWTTEAPPHQPGEEEVVRLTEADHPALTALIDEAFPSTTSRPGAPGVVGWYGIRDGDRLVACGADRSRGDLGFLAGLTVAPQQRGRGLGAALTAAMTRAMLARYDHAALGVYPVNVGAIRLYRRLGFTNTATRNSVRLA
ncbi:GNAT family N-acetyltransferase [Micromonospora sp. 15K316]|uniref:GNAT family N-acetyltransferase n=1 Tax=Micromonospora sp. 15K316 TaxID=2530376 RepID=UPI00104D3F45|nr:GNAT family N-acetyltransferase [Micromonospora sp. 15K316]TDC29138.1 GNAT family N-acetyltransferase [Micromonospora sp. 15K316]